MKKRILSVLLVSILVIGLLPACASKDKAKETSGTDADKKQEESVSVTLNEVAHSIFYAPQYVAIENGYFKEEGIDLTLVTGFGVN